MSKYRKSDTEPETLRQMRAMMTNGKPAPLVADPVSVAMERCFRIYMEFKNKVLVGDKTPEFIMEAIREGRERTVKEVAHLKIRTDALAKWDKMREVLDAGGMIQL